MEKRLLSVTVGASLLAGIGFASNPADAQSRLDNIKRDKMIVVGARESTPPYGYTDKDGKWIGWSIDLGRALTQIIGKKLGMELAYEMKAVTPQTRIPLVVNGTVDAYFGSAGKSVEREDVIDFSLITNAVCVKKLVAKSSAIHATNDLAGKRVGVTKGSLEERTLVAMNAKGELKPPVKVVPFDKHSTGFIALSQGKTDAHVTMDDALIALANASPNPSEWDVRGPDLFCTVSGIIVQENDSNWLDMVNHSLCHFIVTGGYDKLYDEWFSGSSPKAGYQRPLSAEVRFLLRNQCPGGAERFVSAN